MYIYIISRKQRGSSAPRGPRWSRAPPLNPGRPPQFCTTRPQPYSLVVLAPLSLRAAGDSAFAPPVFAAYTLNLTNASRFQGSAPPRPPPPGSCAIWAALVAAAAAATAWGGAPRA